MHGHSFIRSLILCLSTYFLIGCGLYHLRGLPWLAKVLNSTCVRKGTIKLPGLKKSEKLYHHYGTENRKRRMLPTQRSTAWYQRLLRSTDLMGVEITTGDLP